jgi:hypothetical protein
MLRENGGLRRRWLLVVLTVAAALAYATTAHGATVTNTDDSGAGSLRAAILSGDSSITFGAGVSGTVNLLSPLPVISHDVEIQGPGAEQLTVRRDSGGNYRIFEVTSGATVGISGLTIRNGHNPNASDFGGGIYNQGTLTISDSLIQGNTAEGLFAGGGGIYNGDRGSLTLLRSTLDGNRVMGGLNSGGGIQNDYGRLKVKSSLLYRNRATLYGGAIYAINGSPLFVPQTIRNTTITLNQGDRGGGIVAGTAGGPSVSVASSTVADNRSEPGSAANLSGFGLTIANSIIALPRGGPNCDLDPFSEENTVSEGHNLESTNTCRLDQPTDLVGAFADLDVLRDNGGPTLTMRLLATSPAIDCGNAGNLTSDQRGRPRPVDLDLIVNAPGGDGADIGAFEVQSSAGILGGTCASQPPNDFTFGRVIKHQKRGTATLIVEVPGPGKLVLHGTNLRRATKNPAAASKTRLPVRSKGTARRKLRKTGHARVRAKVTFTPTGGLPNTQTKRIMLVKRG